MFHEMIVLKTVKGSARVYLSASSCVTGSVLIHFHNVHKYNQYSVSLFYSTRIIFYCPMVLCCQCQLLSSSQP